MLTPTNTVEDIYPSFLSAAAARGVKDKILDTYKQHFRAISKRLDVSIPSTELRKADLDDMIFAMRESGLSDRSTKSKVDRIFQAPPALLFALAEWKIEQEQCCKEQGRNYLNCEVLEDRADGGFIKG